MDMPVTPQERAEIAELAGVNDQYLYQCLTGRKAMKSDEAVRVERASSQRLRRWHLRRNDWFNHWPELVGADGAPPVPPSETPAAPVAPTDPAADRRQPVDLPVTVSISGELVAAPPASPANVEEVAHGA